MKPSTSLVLFVLALSACKRDSSSAADGSSTTPAMGVASQAAGGPATDMAQAKVRRADVVRLRGSQSTAVMNEAAASGSPPSSFNPFQNVGIGATAPTMVIRTGQAFIEVDKVDPAILKIRQIAALVGGYITNSSVSGGHDQIRQATLELKIPASKYDEAVGTLATIGKVETVSSNAQDVGEEFVDVTARVSNSRRLEER
ncbi:MAG: DUF4349 domain-containing protein, partial [Gemmatimonadota bacterium]|nr:DUF4349 domain-containing protein [Gemmatimonadota bacterium]